MLTAALTTAATPRGGGGGRPGRGPPRARGGGGGGGGPDERLGADPVQVGVVDDGDVARAQPLGEVLGALVYPRRRRDAGQADGPVPAEPGELAEGSCHR